LFLLVEFAVEIFVCAVQLLAVGETSYFCVERSLPKTGNRVFPYSQSGNTKKIGLIAETAAWNGTLVALTLGNNFTGVTSSYA
jgi:hypothetical protein